MKSQKLFFLVFGIFSTLLISFAVALGIKGENRNPYDLKTGDLVFQEGFSEQAIAIKAATGSRWTHVGIIYSKDDELVVIEAVQPVKITSLKRFVARNPESFYAMRLKNREQVFTKEALAKADTYLNETIGKNYDVKFQWSDDRIYCSELVWKVYKEAANIDLCEPRKMKSLNLKHPQVELIIKKRYGSVDALPLEELIVPPSDLAESKLLIEVPHKTAVSKKTE